MNTYLFTNLLAFATLFMIIETLDAIARKEMAHITNRFNDAKPNAAGVRGPIIVAGDFYDLLAAERSLTQVLFRVLFRKTARQITLLKKQYIFEPHPSPDPEDRMLSAASRQC